MNLFVTLLGILLMPFLIIIIWASTVVNIPKFYSYVSALALGIICVFLAGVEIFSLDGLKGLLLISVGTFAYSRILSAKRNNLMRCLLHEN